MRHRPAKAVLGGYWQPSSTIPFSRRDRHAHGFGHAYDLAQEVVGVVVGRLVALPAQAVAQFGREVDQVLCPRQRCLVGVVVPVVYARALFLKINRPIFPIPAM